MIPQVLLLDEITAALTADQAERVFALLAEWREKGRAAVLITHRLAEVRRICDRATILRDGRNVALFEPGAAPATVNGSSTGTMHDVDEHELVEAMLGTDVLEVGERDERISPSPQQSTSRSSSEETAFAVQGLTSGDVVRNVSFELRRGEILGLVALEGQGQERLFSLLSGDRRPTAGEILVGGSQRRWRAPSDAVADGVVLIPGDRLLTLLPNLPVRQTWLFPFSAASGSGCASHPMNANAY